MKRADLIPGAEYLTCRISDWKRPGSHGIKRVRVLDDQPWRRERFGSQSVKIKALTTTGEHNVPEMFQPVSTGGGVLVLELDQATGEPLARSAYQVVQLAQFHATWERGSAQRQEFLDAKRVKEEEREAKAKALNDRADAAVLVLGGTAQHKRFFGGTPEVTLPLDVAEALAEEVTRLRQIDAKHGV